MGTIAEAARRRGTGINSLKRANAWVSTCRRGMLAVVRVPE
jgi:hypothetical protein